MLKTWEVMPQYFITSAIDKTGKDQVITFIDNVNETLNSN
jgi:GTP-binding protein